MSSKTQRILSTIGIFIFVVSAGLWVSSGLAHASSVESKWGMASYTRVNDHHVVVVYSNGVHQVWCNEMEQIYGKGGSSSSSCIELK